MKRLAIFIIGRNYGYRHYGVFDKNGTKVCEARVLDCGQGAAQAYAFFEDRGYAPSGAEWTTKLRWKLEKEGVIEK